MEKYKTVRLGDYVKIKTGKLDANASSEDGAYPFFTCSIEPLKISTYSYDCECCLVAGNGDLNVKYYNGKFDAYQRTYIIESLDKEKLDVMYLFFFLSSYIEVLRKQSIGGVIKYIKLGNLTDALIPIPSLEKQKEICRNLTKAKKVLNENQALLSKYDILIKSRFIEMFGDPVNNSKKWDLITLETITNVGSSKRIFEKEYVPSGIPFYRTKEIVELSKGNAVTTELYISQERYSEIKSKYDIPKKNDLLISAVGTIGIIWIVDGKHDFYYKDGNLIKVDASKKFNSVYMKLLLESLIAEYKKKMSTGTAYSALTISGLSKMSIYNPPIKLQNDFAAFVQQIDKSKFAVQKSLEKAETLYKSLMQAYFG